MPTPASTASDASPAISQVFRLRRLAGAVVGAFGSTTAGATGALCVVPNPTGLFMMRPPILCRLDDTVTGVAAHQLINIKAVRR